MKIVGSFVLLGWLFKTIPLAQVWTSVTQANGAWLAFSGLWIVLSMVVSTSKWQLLLKGAGLQLPWFYVWKVYWMGLFFNNFLPSSIGGDALRIYQVQKTSQLGYASTSASVVLERLLATVGLALLGLGVWPWVGLPGALAKQLLVLFVALLAISAVLLVLVLKPDVLLNRVPLASIRKFAPQLATYSQKLRQQPLLLMQVIGWSMLFQFCVVMVNYSIFRALQVTALTLLDTSFLVPATSVAAMLPIGINGYGVREGAYVFLFSQLQVPQASALTASLLFAVLVSLASLLGGWYTLNLRRDNHVNNGGLHPKLNEKWL